MLNNQTAFTAVFFCLLFFLENSFSVKRAFLKHNLLNLRFILISFGVYQIVKFLLIKKWLLYQQYDYSLLIFVLQFLILDFVTYLWHYSCHRFKPLWKFHLVHHSDTEMNSTTAFRFHFGEFIISDFFRYLLVLPLMIDIRVFAIYQLTLTLNNLLQHSKIALPYKLDSFISYFWVTPKYHQIHHHVEPQYHHSNFCSLLTCWDFLFKTQKRAEENQKIPLGILKKNQLMQPNLKELLNLPFVE